MLGSEFDLSDVVARKGKAELQGSGMQKLICRGDQRELIVWLS